MPAAVAGEAGAELPGQGMVVPDDFRNGQFFQVDRKRQAQAVRLRRRLGAGRRFRRQPPDAGRCHVEPAVEQRARRPVEGQLLDVQFQRVVVPLQAVELQRPEQAAAGAADLQALAAETAGQRDSGVQAGFAGRQPGGQSGGDERQEQQRQRRQRQAAAPARTGGGGRRGAGGRRLFHARRGWPARSEAGIFRCADRSRCRRRSARPGCASGRRGRSRRPGGRP